MLDPVDRRSRRDSRPRAAGVPVADNPLVRMHLDQHVVRALRRAGRPDVGVVVRDSERVRPDLGDPHVLSPTSTALAIPASLPVISTPTPVIPTHMGIHPPATGTPFPLGRGLGDRPKPHHTWHHPCGFGRSGVGPISCLGHDLTRFQHGERPAQCLQIGQGVSGQQHQIGFVSRRDPTAPGKTQLLGAVASHRA